MVFKANVFLFSAVDGVSIVDGVVSEGDVREYREYLDGVFEVLDSQARARGIPLGVSADDVFKEVRFYGIPGFVFPYVAFNGAGGVSLNWKAGFCNVRFERSPGEPCYRLSGWFDEGLGVDYVFNSLSWFDKLPVINFMYNMVVGLSKDRGFVWEPGLKAVVSG